MKTYHGSCHCGAVRFEADIDLARETIRCNCSICAKLRFWPAIVPPQAFRLLCGRDDLSLYLFGTNTERHYFCKHCGVHPFGQGQSSRWGKFYGVNLSCLDNATAQELINAPITYLDGRNDNWHTPPTQVRHL